MTSLTPGSASMREPSTRPSLPTRPMAVRCSPGMGRAAYPISSIALTTPSISTCVAPWRITTSMRSVLEIRPPAVVRDHEQAGIAGANERRYVHRFHGWIQVRQDEPPRLGQSRHLATLLGGEMLDDRHGGGQRAFQHQRI